MTNPVALQIGDWQIRWYGILMALAVALGTWLAIREAQRRNVNPEHIINLVLWGAPLGWIGARIYYVIFEWNYYSNNLAEIPKVWHGGLAIHGGIIAAVLVGIVYTKKTGLSFWQAADIVAPSFILGQAIGRWGNFFNQEAYGYPTNLPWAMYIDGAYRHPTFLYESLWDLGIFLFLWLFFRYRGRKGEVFLVYLGLYSLGRFWIEGLRTDSLMLGSFRVAQLMSLLLILAAIVTAVLRRHTSR